jgi:phosphoglycolate phosphatase
MNSAYLFDIDGTILNVDKNFMYPLIEEILHSFSIDPEIVNRIDYAGHTDASIFRRLLGDRQKDTRLFNRFKQAYINKMDENLTASDVTVFDGAVESVEYLHHRKEFLGLLTGNFKETARIKLRAAGLDQFFSFGAFGCRS